VPLVSPLRGGEVRGSIEVVIGAGPRPAEPRVEPTEPASVEMLDPDHEDESALPDEARRRVVANEEAATDPVEALPSQALHVRFRIGAQDGIIDAFRSLNEVFRGRPGQTPVVLHIPVDAERVQAMELPLRVAYDAELLAAVRRRFAEGAVQLKLR
jgi:hypothetical protein